MSTAVEMGLCVPVRRRRIYLVRHGHVDYFDDQGRPLDPRSVTLSDNGEKQVRALAEVLSPLNFDRAICSDYPRARQTAELILSSTTDLEQSSDLREVRAGRFREIPAHDLERAISNAYRNFDEADGSFIGGERWDAFEERVLGRFRALLEEPTWEVVVA